MQSFSKVQMSAYIFRMSLRVFIMCECVGGGGGWWWVGGYVEVKVCAHVSALNCAVECCVCKCT